MAAKKFYAVKRGKITGVFDGWEACKNSVDGYPGAEYKGFSSIEEAYAFMGTQECTVYSSDTVRKESVKDAAYQGCGRAVGIELPGEGQLLAYVDGSYDDSLKKYAFGCVFILPDGRIYAEYGNGDNEQSLQHRNVTGEMLGSMFAVKFAMKNGFEGIEIRYDYQGIEKWVTGEWRSKTELTRKYAEAMREWGKTIAIRFQKVQAHSNVKYNDLADKLAKTGLTEGAGVPKIRLVEEMEEYAG